MNTKIIRASKLNIASGTYSFQNVCRNMYGDVIQVKYFEDSYGLPYFLSLHEKYFLVFQVKTSFIGDLEILLLKAIPIPDNELSGKSLEIVIAGDDKVYLRDDCNAHEVDLSQNLNLQIQEKIFVVSVPEVLLIILTHYGWKEINFETYRYISVRKDYFQLITLAFEFVGRYKNSVDLCASKFLFCLYIRLNYPIDRSNYSIWADLLDFEIFLAYKSDSNVIFGIYVGFIYFLEYFNRSLFELVRGVYFF